MIGKRIQPVELLSLSILLSIASFFRFHLLEEKLVFQGDQGRALLAARDILAGQLTLVGPETSVSGFHLGPFFYYLIAPALWLAQYDPLGPAVLTAVFGVATVALLYFYGRRFFSWETGLGMGLLYALSPHAMWQSRIALEPSPLPFFSILWLFALSAWRESREKHWLITAFVSILLGCQLNFSFAALVPATIWLMLEDLPVTRKQVHWLRSSSLLLLTALIIGKAWVRPVTPWTFFTDIWTQLTLPEFPTLATALLIAIFLCGARLTWKQKVFSSSRSLLPIGAWLVFAFSAFVLKYVSGEHSLALLFPAPAIALGLMCFFWSQGDTLKKQAAFGFLALASCFLIFQSWGYLQNTEATTLHTYEETSTHILELAAGEPYRFVYRGHLDVYDAADDAYQYLLWKSGQPPVQSYRREIGAETEDHWNASGADFRKTIVLYQPPFAGKQYQGFQEREEWNGIWFSVEPSQ